MITFPELRSIYYKAVSNAPRHANLLDYGLTAVLHALEPVIAKSCGQAMSCASPESYKGNKSDAELAEAARQDMQAAAAVAKMAIDRLLAEGPYKITLGDTTTREGVADCAARSQTVSISPASFCEWKQIAQTNHYIRSCNGDEKFYDCFSHFSKCHHCKKPIKFMADASTRKDEDDSRSGERLSVTIHTSAATIDEDALIEFVRDWEYSGYAYDLNFARKLKQKLLEAGYKVLSREPTEEMVDAVTLSPAHRILVKQDWRKQWDAAK